MVFLNETAETMFTMQLPRNTLDIIIRGILLALRHDDDQLVTLALSLVISLTLTAHHQPNENIHTQIHTTVLTTSLKEKINSSMLPMFGQCIYQILKSNGCRCVQNQFQEWSSDRMECEMLAGLVEISDAYQSLDEFECHGVL